MKPSVVAIAFAVVIALSNALPVPEESSSTTAKSDDDTKTPSGVANTLTQGTKTLVETKTSLLKGLTGSVPSSLQADASSTNEAVQRNERGSASGGYSGYPSSSYGPNSVSETPNNFINVFSQAAANTVNFGTQLLNSLVGVAANILQGTVSTLLSLLNAKGQVVGAVVQSAPPVLASVTRTAGDVLAAKARIFGAVTQSAVNFGSQLAQTLTNIFAGLFNGPNAINFNALTGGGRSSDGGSGGGNVLGGVGNFAQTIINAKLNLLNGLLSPFTGGRPLLNFGGGSGGGGGLAALFGSLSGGLGGSASSSSSSSSGGYSSPSEPNFRITITATSPAPSSSTDGPLRPTRYFSSQLGSSGSNALPGGTQPNSLDELNPANLLATFSNGVVQGIVEQFSKGANGNNNPFLAGGSSSTDGSSSSANNNNANSLGNLFFNLNNNNGNARNSVTPSSLSANNNFLAAFLNPTVAPSSNNNQQQGSSKPVSSPLSQSFFNFPTPTSPSSSQNGGESTPKIRNQQNLRNLIARLFPGTTVTRNKKSL
ncbi:unnamed protein product [Orchesella dallaii]|uniref:Uncharacterized protein n=1 Tax=Orchesella dallaii TaxID=48710 RepID=A0ABP1PW31_9HEXA